MTTRIILTGHGHFATGLLSCLELIAGKDERFEAIDFEEYDTEDSLRQKYMHCLEAKEDEEILFVCDLVGGTPFKTSVELSYLLDEAYVVAGVSLSALLEGALGSIHLTAVELAQLLIESTGQNTYFYTKKQLQPQFPCEEEEGI